MGKKDFPALTGIRFLAASFVFLCHYPGSIVSESGQPFLFFFLKQLNIGVTLFFVLSGFLITYRYYPYVTSRRNLRPYFLKRFARIFPLYFLILAVQFLLLLKYKGIDNLFWTLLLNITLLKGLSQEYIFTGIAQSWSLTVEEMFYFFAPFSFFLIKLRGWIFTQVILLLGLGSLLALFFSSQPFLGFFSNFSFMFSSTFFGRCFEFFVGIIVALLIMRKKESICHLKNTTLIGALLFCFFLLITAYYACVDNVPSTNKTTIGILLFNFLMPISIGIFYYGLLTENTTLQQLLSIKWIVLLGKSSYAFYLIHFGMIFEVISFQISSNILVLYLMLQLLSVILYKGFEKPIYFLLLKKFNVNQTRAVESLWQIQPMKKSF